MNKLLILTFIFFFTTNIYSKVNFSVKSGLTYSNAELTCEGNRGFSSSRCDEITKPQYKIGGILSLSGEYEINDLLSVNLELSYNQKHFKWMDGGSKILQMLEFPFLINFKLFNDFKLYFGVFYSKTLNESAWTYAHTYPDDYGYLLGLKYNYKKILFEFRFEQGLDIIFDNYIDNGDGPEIYKNSRQFSLMIGYSFF
jgi:hypothetical protein